MQDHDYPVLLLFCGTFHLKPLIREHDSIFFNTVKEHQVGYLSRSESAELLQRPANGILEYDPLVLRQAYGLTHGQPLLLQLLGETVIHRFDEQLEAGEPRDDYVDLNDLEAAATTLARRDNPAYQQHWHDCDPVTRRLLSALARVTDERDRPRLDFEGILQAMAEYRLAPADRSAAFKAVQRLAEEEVLVGERHTYHYAVPLYRRWVAWRWPPQKLAEEGDCFL